MHALQDELGQMMKTFEANHRSLSDYDGIYFVGEHAASFPLRASQIANGLENFRGVIVNSLSHEKRLRISNQINNAGFWSFVSLNEIVKSSQKDKFLVVDFNDTLAGVQFRNFLSSSGIDALDYLRCMHDLDLVHTYLPVSEERQIILDSLPSYVNLVQELADPLSRNTVIARLKTYISLDRTHLHRVSQPFGLFTKHSQSHCALVINDKEEFVDAGAAHGDTVAEFYNACNGSYKSCELQIAVQSMQIVAEYILLSRRAVQPNRKHRLLRSAEQPVWQQLCQPCGWHSSEQNGRDQVG